MNKEPHVKAVMITGASTGIGAACALHLDGRGVKVFAGVRNASDGAALKQNASDRLTPVLIDVTLPDAIAAARRVVADAIDPGGLAGVVNSAGIFLGGPLEFASLDDLREEFEVNLFGTIAVTQAFLPALRKGRGRVVNIGSYSGQIALPFLGPYAASKHALEAISDSWRVELRRWGIWVAVIEPGVVDTPLREKVIEKLRKIREAYPPEAHELYGQVFGMTEEQPQRGMPALRVAETVEHALFASRPKRRYVVGADAILLSIFRKLPAGLRDWYIGKHIETRHRPA
ncbi:MAG: SDR family NAD(P)-dependent oxidoreductase [Thermoplasmata archaeon]